jgi:hypothetical protein
MTPEEKRLARRYYRKFGGTGNTYSEEFKINESGPGSRARRVDAIIAEGRDRVDAKDLRCLEGRNITIIQAKATPLNAWLVGQALLSPRLLARSARLQGWKPGNIRSIALCDIQPAGVGIGRSSSGLGALIEKRFTRRDLEIVTLEVPDEDKKHTSSIRRIPGAAARYAGDAAPKTARLPTGLTVSGILTPDPRSGGHKARGWEGLVAGQPVTVIHSEQENKKPKMSAMYMAGEVVTAQLLLTHELGAASAESVIACESMDAAVADELAAFGVPFRVWDITKPGLTGLGPVVGRVAQACANGNRPRSMQDHRRPSIGGD